MALLGEIGIPVYQKDGRFFINRDYYRATMRLNLNEAITLLVAVRVTAYHQDQQNPHVISLMRKLADILPSLPSEHTLTMLQRMAWGHPVDRAYVMVFETIVRGWCERRVVKLWDGKAVYEFATYFLEPSPTGAIFAVGRDMTSGKIGALRLSRVKRVTLLKTPYDVPPHANPYRYLSSIVADEDGLSSEEDEVQFIFSETAGAVLQRDTAWAHAHIEPLKDQRVLLRLPSADWRSLLPWIRSWGPEVEAVAPTALRDHLASDAALLSAVYNK